MESRQFYAVVGVIVVLLAINYYNVYQLTLLVGQNTEADLSTMDRLGITENRLATVDKRLDSYYNILQKQNQTLNNYYVLLKHDNVTGLFKMGCYPIDISAIPGIDYNNYIILVYVQPVLLTLQPLVCPK